LDNEDYSIVLTYMVIAPSEYAESLKLSTITLVAIITLYKPVRAIRVIAAWYSGISYKVEQQPHRTRHYPQCYRITSITSYHQWPTHTPKVHGALGYLVVYTSPFFV